MLVEDEDRARYFPFQKPAPEDVVIAVHVDDTIPDRRRVIFCESHETGKAVGDRYDFRPVVVPFRIFPPASYDDAVADPPRCELTGEKLEVLLRPAPALRHRNYRYFRDIVHSMSP